jgi:succinyl-CoA synthetase alpha subunit
MRLVGPSCFGIIVPWLRLDASLAAHHPVPGVAGVVVQSGGVGIALLEQMSRLGIGVSSFVSLGDKYDVAADDLLTWWAQDEVTQIAILYTESFGRAPGRAADAGADGGRRPLPGGAACRGLAPRQGDDAAGQPGGAVRPGGDNCHHEPR